MVFKKLFGNTVEPACTYCRFGVFSCDGVTILCRKQGVLSAFSRCRHYHYDPLKRLPHEQPVLPQYDPTDFSL